MTDKPPPPPQTIFTPTIQIEFPSLPQPSVAISPTPTATAAANNDYFNHQQHAIPSSSTITLTQSRHSISAISTMTPLKSGGPTEFDGHNGDGSARKRDSGTVSSSEYALHVLFAQFAKVADNKMELILTSSMNEQICSRVILYKYGGAIDGIFRSHHIVSHHIVSQYKSINPHDASANPPSQDRELDLSYWIGPDSDPFFDKLLKSLGSIASHRPKPVIDLVMGWRKAKSEPIDPVLVRKMT
ncbi:hypothetical protein BC938DRAFT_475091 [Jimgerdemannia flammicorona]|uniref:Uncharacterized protein n=1 Tax=Jimgerdemannia flammicorona TaxID=994334 RepID=A0A433QS03_9FUNG|nr:hypothetical protein BC938DRAFT_475091 [Jimgerdemannia flammicorona]